jgi:hypothetical protein
MNSTICVMSSLFSSQPNDSGQRGRAAKAGVCRLAVWGSFGGFARWTALLELTAAAAKNAIVRRGWGGEEVVAGQ